MGIKYVEVPEQRKTVAILENCKYDCVVKISKILGETNSLCFNPNKYLLNNTYRAVVVCHPDDAYDVEEGKRRAKKKLLDHYYEQVNKTLDRFIDDLNTAAYATVTRIRGCEIDPRS